MKKTIRCRPSTESGQAVIMAVAIALLLILTIPVMVYFGNNGNSRGISSLLHSQGEALAIEGINYARGLLSTSSTTWTNALNSSNSNPPLSTDCPSGSFGPLIPSISGGQFRLQCTPNPPYEIDVKSVSYVSKISTLDAHGHPKLYPSRAVEAVLSQRTIAAHTTDGISAGAALQLATTPYLEDPITSHLSVDWGPIVELDTNTWVFNQELDSATTVISGVQTYFIGYPRKFSQGGIGGGWNDKRAPDLSASRHTDHKEYWAFFPEIIPPSIDTTTYQDIAQREGGGASPQFKPAVTRAPAVVTNTGTMDTSACVLNPSNCGYFTTNSSPPTIDTITFGGAGTTYVPWGPDAFGNIPTGVIVINANAKFIDVKIASATVIVVGNLELGDATAPVDSGAGNTLFLRVPPTAPLEYPFWPSSDPNGWPCKGNSGCKVTSIPSTTPGVHISGQLIVYGNLIVHTPHTPFWPWFIDGTVQVGNLSQTPATGRLIIEPTATLEIRYDDVANRILRVNPSGQRTGTTARIDLLTDFSQDISIPDGL